MLTTSGWLDCTPAHLAEVLKVLHAERGLEASDDQTPIRVQHTTSRQLVVSRLGDGRLFPVTLPTADTKG